MNFLVIPIYYQEWFKKKKNPNIFSGSSDIISTMKAFIAWKTYVYAIEILRGHFLWYKNWYSITIFNSFWNMTELIL